MTAPDRQWRDYVPRSDLDIEALRFWLEAAAVHPPEVWNDLQDRFLTLFEGLGAQRVDEIVSRAMHDPFFFSRVDDDDALVRGLVKFQRIIDKLPE